jgi:hypothetical protein
VKALEKLTNSMSGKGGMEICGGMEVELGLIWNQGWLSNGFTFTYIAEKNQ